MARGVSGGENSPIQMTTYNSDDIEGYNPVNNFAENDSKSPESRRQDGFQSFLNVRRLPSETTVLSDLSQDVQRAHPPLFIPRFSGLRQLCLDETQTELRTIEKELQQINPTSPDRSAKVADAVRLLHQLDQATESEVTRLQMEDPNYATSRGLTIVHFLTDGNPIYNGQWIMISRAWGRRSKSILETNAKLLSSYHRDCIREFMTGSCRLWFQRPKTAAEQQRGSLRYGLDGSLTRRTGRILLWKAIVVLAIIALILFYGVGIISTNSTFSPIFVQYFYWVAIFWSLISSYLLYWLVGVLGASQRDSFGAFLSAIAIWLVVIQIGQTHLNGQNAQAAAANATQSTQ